MKVAKNMTVSAEYLALYVRSLDKAAEEAYLSEVVDTLMEGMLIGEGLDYPSKQAWVEDKIAQWLESASEDIGFPIPPHFDPEGVFEVPRKTPPPPKANITKF